MMSRESNLNLPVPSWAVSTRGVIAPVGKQAIKTILRFIGPWRTSPLADPSPIHDSAHHGTFYASDGTEIYYEDTQDRGETLFFLYGLGCSIFHWKHQLSFFLKESQLRKKNTRPYRIVWMDFRAHGLSDPWKPEMDLSFDRMVQDIAELCEYLGIKRATFLGQSMGGSLAAKLAHKYPNLVQTLVFQGSPMRGASRTVAGGPVVGSLLRTTIRLNESMPGIVRASFRLIKGKLQTPFREIIRFSGFNPLLVDIQDVDEYVKKLLDSNPNVFFRLAGELEKFSIEELRPRISCPVLILAGAHDVLVPLEYNRWLASYLPNAELAVFDHGSHCPHLDDPALINETIRNFLKSHVQKRQPPSGEKRDKRWSG